MQGVDEWNVYVVLTQGSFRNEIGEMSSEALYGYVGTKRDLGTAEAVRRELEEKGLTTVPFPDPLGLTTMEIRRIG